MKKVSIILAGLLLVTVGFVFAQGNSQNMGSMMDTSQTQSSTGMWGQGMMYGLQGQDMPMMGMANNFTLLLCHFGCPGFLLTTFFTRTSSTIPYALASSADI